MTAQAPRSQSRSWSPSKPQALPFFVASTEPKPLPDATLESWDFEALADRRARDPEYNAQRLKARRKLLTWGKAAQKRCKAETELALDVRTSIHNPHAFNGNSVRRLWVYMVRAKAEKTRLRKVLGRDLAKDLDSAYRNAYLTIALEPDRLEVGLRIHADAWYDGRNLANRFQADGPAQLLALLRTLDGFQLRLHDWKGEWPCGEDLTPEKLEDYFKHWIPGEHHLIVDRRFPVPSDPAAREAAMAPEVPGMLQDELLRLVPLYRYAVWSEESDHLFSK